jgi:hypothetical protein
MLLFRAHPDAVHEALTLFVAVAPGPVQIDHRNRSIVPSDTNSVLSSPLCSRKCSLALL